MSSQADSQTGASSDSTGCPVANGDSSSAATRIRVGLIGLDRAGQFHAERLSLRADVEVVAACDPSDGQPRRLPGPLGADRRDRFPRGRPALADRFHHSADRRSDRRGERTGRRRPSRPANMSPSIPPLLQRRPDGRLARRGPSNRSATLDSADPPRRHRISDRNGNRPRRATGPDQLGTLDLLGQGRFPRGRLDGFDEPHGGRSVCDFRLSIRRPVVAVDRPSPAVACSAGFLARLPRRAGLDRLYARDCTSSPGVDALIDVNLQSGAVLETGWMLAGARGGYGGGRIYLEETSGEISDAPVSESHLPEVDIYGEFLASVGGEHGPTASARDAERALRVIAAARESSRTGNAVSIEPAVSIAIVTRSCAFCSAARRATAKAQAASVTPGPKISSKLTWPRRASRAGLHDPSRQKTSDAGKDDLARKQLA